MKIFGMCLNWKVIAGLAVVAGGIWLLAPNLIGAALPLLIVLVCPLSMLLMMRGMGNMGTMGAMRASAPAPQLRQPELPRAVPLTRAERLADLHARLASIQAEQDALAREMAALQGSETPDTSDIPVVRQAEAVARAAEEQMPGTQASA